MADKRCEVQQEGFLALMKYTCMPRGVSCGGIGGTPDYTPLTCLLMALQDVCHTSRNVCKSDLGHCISST
eukprot:1157666-Pelagomonas_calceolata.AAC.5